MSDCYTTDLNSMDNTDATNLGSTTWHIKICQKGHTKKAQANFTYYEHYMLETNSIGICYGIHEDITSKSRSEIETFMSSENGYGPKHRQQTIQFIHELKIGDTILLGCGWDEILYSATIDSDAYFTNNPRLKNSLKTRRRIKDIKQLPPGTKINKKFCGTIKRLTNYTLS